MYRIVQINLMYILCSRLLWSCVLVCDILIPWLDTELIGTITVLFVVGSCNLKLLPPSL